MRLAGAPLASPGPRAPPPQLPGVPFPSARTEPQEEPRPGGADRSGGGGPGAPGVLRSPEGAQQEARKKEAPREDAAALGSGAPTSALLGGRWSREGSQVSVWLTIGHGP